MDKVIAATPKAEVIPVSPSPSGKKPTLSPERFKSLSVSVFSIALTLLIIDVVTTAKQITPGMTLSEHLLSHVGTGVAYFVGFLTIFVCWVNHHAVLDQVDRVDLTLIWVGGLLLGLVSAVPLPTALLADHFTGPSSHSAFFLIWRDLLPDGELFLGAQPHRPARRTPGDGGRSGRNSAAEKRLPDCHHLERALHAGITVERGAGVSDVGVDVRGIRVPGRIRAARARDPGGRRR